MKTILLGLFSIIMFVSYGQESKTVTATFDGYEEGVYYFSNNDDDSYNFEKIEPEVLEAFDLEDDKYLDKAFKIAYRIEKEEDEFGDKYDVWVIIKLELINQE